MNYFSEAIAAAIQLIFQFDSINYEIVWTSLKISLIATFFVIVGFDPRNMGGHQ